MLRLIWKSIFVAIVSAVIIYEFRLLARIIGPEVSPLWSRVRAEARKHGVAFGDEEFVNGAPEARP